MQEFSMRHFKAHFSLTVLLSVLLLSAGAVFAQDDKDDGKPVERKQIKWIGATARGTSTQLGRLTNIDIRISKVSSSEEQQFLLQAFQANGSKGLTSAVDKLSAKGRIAITGTL